MIIRISYLRHLVVSVQDDDRTQALTDLIGAFADSSSTILQLRLAGSRLLFFATSQSISVPVEGRPTILHKGTCIVILCLRMLSVIPVLKISMHKLVAPVEEDGVVLLHSRPHDP